MKDVWIEALGDGVRRQRSQKLSLRCLESSDCLLKSWEISRTLTLEDILKSNKEWRGNKIKEATKWMRLQQSPSKYYFCTDTRKWTTWEEPWEEKDQLTPKCLASSSCSLYTCFSGPSHLLKLLHLPPFSQGFHSCLFHPQLSKSLLSSDASETFYHAMPLILCVRPLTPLQSLNPPSFSPICFLVIRLGKNR